MATISQNFPGKRVKREVICIIVIPRIALNDKLVCIHGSETFTHGSLVWLYYLFLELYRYPEASGIAMHAVVMGFSFMMFLPLLYRKHRRLQISKATSGIIPSIEI